MSTDMQQYSIANQHAAINAYAERHGLTIVCDYEDAGRSGLRLKGRPALKSLIVDVMSGRANFDTILVYDVSRWGRFQDSDESAHYEYICKQAGVSVQYCAEQFSNDGSISASILKNIKRAMAGEFSRELSMKVHAGQSRIARLGFHVGGTPGYALRRQLLDQNGVPKFELRLKERKSIQSERVILVPGPAHEIDVVQHVYSLFIDAKSSLNEIARTLNAQLVPNVQGREWTSIAVRELLANEKYMGTSVYNRTSKKLGLRWSRNPPIEWVRKIGAYQGIVSASQFEKARRQLRSNASEYSEAELLDSLTAIWCRNQALTRDIVSQTPGAPSTNTIRRHFGSLTNAFRKIGFVSARQANYDLLQQLRREVYAKITEGVPLVDSTISVASGRNGQLRVNGEIDLTVVIGRASQASVARGHNQWRFGYRSERKPHILLVARIDHGCSCIRDFYALPYLFMPHGSWITVSGVNYHRLEAFRFATLEPVFELCARVPKENIIMSAVGDPTRRQARQRRAAEAQRKIEATARTSQRIANVLAKATELIADPRFREVMIRGNLASVPRILCTLPRSGEGQVHAEALALDFVVAWQFLYPLMSSPSFAAQFESISPGLAAEMKDVFIALVLDGPFPLSLSGHKGRRHAGDYYV